MAQGSSIEWTEATWNPVTGCTKVSPGCKHCLAPETLVLGADMAWRPIGELKVGDRLVGFDEHLQLGHNRAIRKAVVQKVWRSIQPTVRLRVGQREVITTADHQWLCEPRPWWRTTEQLRLGVKVRVFGDAVRTEESPDFMAGYVAGMTLGDGTFRFDPAWRSDKLGFPQMYWRVAVSDRGILDRLIRYLAAFGIAVEAKPFFAGDEKHKPIWKVETRAKAKLQAIAELCVDRDTENWCAGWLSGMFDAEGSHDRNLRISQKDFTVLEKGAAYAAALGVATKVERFKGHAGALRVEGGSRDKAKFLSAIRPAVPRKVGDLFGRRLDAQLEEVTAIERLGEREVVDIQTSTGTFIAAGICTHNCYAERMSIRLRAMDNPRYTNGFDVTLHEDLTTLPLRWKKPRRIFVNSMSDLFHADVPPRFLAACFDTMRRAHWHTYQILTKRPERAAELADALPWPANVWMGTSVENADYYWRIDELRKVPAAVRFLSVEPLLGPVDDIPLVGIDWVIAGGESGPRCRPMHPDWPRALRDRCVEHDVAFFFKQWGGVNKKRTGRLLDDRTWDEMPEGRGNDAFKG